ncbi:MAG: hypothetical protein WCJ45_01460 [bacterium]
MSDLYQENFITAYFLVGIVTIFTLGSLGVGNVSRVYQRGIPKEIVCEFPSFVAITGAVIAIFSEIFVAITGAVIEILSFFVFPPKIYPATIQKPLFNHH